jgi:hypothetical protein
MQQLAPLDRTFLAREIARRTVGEEALEQIGGPLIWHLPDSAMAQVIKLMTPSGLVAMQVPLELMARCLAANEYLASREAPSVWAEQWAIREGLIPAECLGAGVGEGMGLARSVGYPVYDTHCVAIFDALTPHFGLKNGPEKTEKMKTAWLGAIKPYEMAFAGYVMVTLLHGPWFGAQRLMEMVEAKIFTKDSTTRLIAAGFGERGMEVGDLIRIIRG